MVYLEIRDLGRMLYNVDIQIFKVKLINTGSSLWHVDPLPSLSYVKPACPSELLRMLLSA
jgi:hypothetical protein